MKNRQNIADLIETALLCKMESESYPDIVVLQFLTDKKIWEFIQKSFSDHLIDLIRFKVINGKRKLFFQEK